MMVVMRDMGIREWLLACKAAPTSRRGTDVWFAREDAKARLLEVFDTNMRTCIDVRHCQS
ncbi:hypothetical protein LY78DRAFT_659536 [Colletotrichum sublineola]|nr:hypothetical protein LY78DRAFT_659536 [Colletotrichum sublineola]